MNEEELRAAERERAYVLDAARWDSFICRGLVERTLPALIAEVRRLSSPLSEECLLRVEESLDIYDRTHHYPATPDHVMPISATARALLAEVRRLRADLRLPA